MRILAAMAITVTVIERSLALGNADHLIIFGIGVLVGAMGTFPVVELLFSCIKKIKH